MKKPEQFWLHRAKVNGDEDMILDAPSDDATHVITASYAESILRRAISLFRDACVVQMPYCGCRACNHLLWFKGELEAFQKGSKSDKS